MRLWLEPTDTLMQMGTNHDHLIAVPSSDAQSSLAQSINSAVKAEKHLCSQHAQLVFIKEGQACRLRMVQS